MDRTQKWLKVLWRLVVSVAVFVALPQLAVGLLVITPYAAGSITTEPLHALLVSLWPLAGAAGLLALLMSRQRRLRLSRVRTYQAMLAGGIVAALAAMVLIGSEVPRALGAVCAAAFVVLIVDAAVRMHALEERAAVLAAPRDRLAALLLGLSALAALAAVAGHLLI